MSQIKEHPRVVIFGLYFFGWILFHYLEHAIGLYFGWRFFLDPNFGFFDTLFGAGVFSVLMLICADFTLKKRKELELSKNDLSMKK
jgi:hypothetical protein